MTLNAIFQSRGFDAAQISHIQVEGVYTSILLINKKFSMILSLGYTKVNL